jgi:hypothetical protein
VVIYFIIKLKMRIKRGKKYHKFVNFYRVVYKFVPPFKTLVDGNFIFAVTKSQLDLKS